MNEEQQVRALERAILDRAHGLADELYAKAAHQRDEILRNTAERLHLTEQREVLSAKATAERNLRRQVQAGELKLQGRLEQLRWQLVLELEQRLIERMAHLRADTDAYQAWLEQMIIEAAEQIPGDLIAELNADDLTRLAPQWADLIQRLLPQRQIRLGAQPIDGIGGVLVSSSDGRIRLDNRFEGRLARRSASIRRAIQQQLFPSG
jgi:V/A-type H+-transporting ATPase subunit E